ncbi:MAG: response regulator transcription factor [Pseudomonadota bacterium]
MSGSPNIRVLIVDDDVEFGDDLAWFMHAHAFDVSIARNVPEARDFLKESTPDICLIDIMMPGPNGRVLCRELADTTDVGVIMISALSDSETVIAMLEVGADDYMTKPFRFPELSARVRAVLRRKNVSKTVPAVTGIGPWSFEFDQRRVRHKDGHVVPLTPSEIALLRFMAASPGTVFSRADLLAVTRARHHEGLDDRAVDNLVKRLRRKIEEDPANARYLVNEWGKGYRLVG